MIAPISAAVMPPISGAVAPVGAGEWSVGSVGGLGSGVPGVGTAGASGSFGGMLTNAISSLEGTQATATNAAQQLATGHATDPTQAVTAVENASLEMNLASQIRTKLDDDFTNIFQTQA